MLRRIVMNRNFIHDSCICIKDSLIPILVITIAIAAFSDAHDAWINCGHRLVEIIITGGKDICCAGIRHPTSPSFISDFPPCNSIGLWMPVGSAKRTFCSWNRTIYIFNKLCRMACSRRCVINVYYRMNIQIFTQLKELVNSNIIRHPGCIPLRKVERLAQIFLCTDCIFPVIPIRQNSARPS